MSDKNKKPVIGLSSNYAPDKLGEGQVQMNGTYLNAIRHFGGIPVVLPVDGDPEELKLLVDLCDGIVLTGGVDLDPSLYGEAVWNDTVQTLPLRDQGEWAICKLAEKRNLPMLGICRGIQTINVYFGGTLYQDLPSQFPVKEGEETIKHSMDKPFNRTAHNCRLEKDTPMYEAIGCEMIGVNSHHHQAVKDVAPGFKVAGYSTDGVIEAIYHPEKPFIWGVQWHPERIWSFEDSSAKVFEAFVEATRKQRS